MVLPASLRLSNLSKLPVSLRVLAEKAAKGDANALQELCEGIAQDSDRPIPTYYHPIVAAAFYALIDVDVPAPQKAASLDFPHANIRCVVLAMRCLSALIGDHHVSPSTFPEVWKRVWAWTELLDACRDNLHPATRVQFYATSLGIMRVIWTRGNDAGERLISRTPRFREIIGRGWHYSLEAHYDEGLFECATLLGFDETGRKNSDKAHFEELVEGAGGSREELARLIVAHVSHAYPRPDRPPPSEGLKQTTGIIWLLTETFDLDDPFREGLLDQGIVKALTTAACSLTKMLSMRTNTDAPAKTFLIVFLRILLEIFRSVWCQKWLAESFRAGLLPLIYKLLSDPALAHLDDGPGEETLPAFMGVFLREELPAFTVYYSVLVSLRNHLTQLEDFDPNIEFQERPEALEDWKRFIDLLHSRLRLVDTFKSKSLPRLRVCDNTKCGRICPKSDFKRCGGCGFAYYCSKQCQRTDFYDGGHKEACEELSDRMTEEECAYSHKDRAFFRFLLEHDYNLRREDVALKILRFMYAHSSEYTFAQGLGAFPYVTFDYTSGRCRISINSLDSGRITSQSVTLD